MILVGEEQWFSSSWGRIAGFSKFSFFVASLCCYSRNVRLDGVKTGWGRTSFGTKTPSPFSSLIYSRHSYALSTSTITFSFLFFFFPRGPSEEEERTMVVWISQKVWVWGQVLSIVE